MGVGSGWDDFIAGDTGGGGIITPDTLLAQARGTPERTIGDLMGQSIFDSKPPYRLLGTLMEVDQSILDAALAGITGSPSSIGDRRNRIRTSFPKGTLALVSENGRLASFSAGNYLLDSGEPGNPWGMLVDDQGNIVKSGSVNLSDGGTGGTGGGVDVAGQVAVLQEQARLADIAAEKERDFDKKQAELDRAENLRLQAQQMENNLRTQAMSDIESARQEHARLAGVEPFKFAASRMGQRAPRHTPVSVFRDQLQQTAQTELPAFNPNASMEEIGENIRQMEGLATNPPTQPFGLEFGGEVIKPEKDASPVSPFSTRPDPFTALQYAEKMGMTPLVVGERTGGPELLLAPKGTQVIPLSDDEEAEIVPQVKGAQFGFGFNDTEQRFLQGAGFDQPDPLQQTEGARTRRFGSTAVPSFGFGYRGGSSNQPLRNLFLAARANVVRGAETRGGTAFANVGEAVEAARRNLGVVGAQNPNIGLITGALEREGGVAEGARQFAPLQFLRRSALGSNLSPQNELLARGIRGTGTFSNLGSNVAGRLGFSPPPPEGVFTEPRPGSGFTGVISHPVTGTLPTPGKIAPFFTQLDPATQEVVMDAYALAGFPRAAFEESIRSAFIPGKERGVIGR